jgi:NAD(P)-dependent dehydrogenase (short-subunit alcohol dehydrogenase family)
VALGATLTVAARDRTWLEALASEVRAGTHALALHPLGRLGEPDDVANAILWFLSPRQSWVTGQVLAVDGGLTSIQPRVPFGG